MCAKFKISMISAASKSNERPPSRKRRHSASAENYSISAILSEHNKAFSSVVERFFSSSDSKEDDNRRQLIVEMVKSKVKRVAEARLDDVEEDLGRLFKFYINNPEPGVKFLDD